MTQKQKYMINEGLILLAFAYAFDGYQGAAVFTGIMAAAAAVFLHGDRLNRHVFPILLTSFFELLVIRCTDLISLVPACGLLVLLNTMIAFLWMDSPFAVIDRMVRFLMAQMIFCYIAAMIVPSGIYTFAEMIILISVIYLPAAGTYIIRCIRETAETEYFMEEKTCLR